MMISTKFLALFGLVAASSTMVAADSDWVYTKTVLVNLDTTEPLSNAELDFFEESWVEAYNRVLRDEDAVEENPAMIPGPSIDAFFIVDTDQGIVTDEDEEPTSDRNLGLKDKIFRRNGGSYWNPFSNWFAILGLSDTSCRMCKEDDDYYPYGRQVEEEESRNLRFGKIFRRRGGSSLSPFSDWFAILGLANTQCTFCKEDDDYNPYGRQLLGLDDIDTDEMRIKVEAQILSLLKDGAFPRFHTLEDVHLEVVDEE